MSKIHELTVDDLIIEYMIYKVKNGYEPSFLTSEFISFLYYFEKQMPVQDVLYKNEELFKRFFARKANGAWLPVENWGTDIKEPLPHMEMTYSEKDSDYIISANNRLCNYDSTYFMDQQTNEAIKRIINEFLSNQPKRILDESAEVSEQEITIGKNIAAEIIEQIWHSYICDYIKKNMWPEQCKDIIKYLFETDLSQIINLPSIKVSLIELYNTLIKRISVLYHQDNDLKIYSYHGLYLPRANYELLIQGFETQFNNTYGHYKKTLKIDSDTIASTLKDEKVAKLVRTIDKAKK